MSSDELGQALGEALELFNQANRISGLQVHAELEQAFAADQPSGSDLAPDSTAPEAMLNFWIEQGLTTGAASTLLDELRARGRSYTINQVSSKVQRLRRVLPDADIASLASKDPQLLDVDMNTALMNMICLVEAFPGKDIMLLLARQPRLLWCDDLRDRVARVHKKLFQLHPSKDVSVIREIIVENPELLYRMDYYMDAMLLDYLPIEIQNMMVLTGQGIGFLYRYYNNSRTNYEAEKLRNDFPSSD